MGISCDLDPESIWCLHGGGEIPSLLAEVGLSQILGHYPELQTAEEAKQPELAEATSPSPHRAQEGLRRGLCSRHLGGQGDFVTHTRVCVSSAVLSHRLKWHLQPCQPSSCPGRPCGRGMMEGRGCLCLVSSWVRQLPAPASTFFCYFKLYLK